MVWQCGSILLNQPLLLPSPFAALRRLAELALTVPFWASIVQSSARIASGFTLGCLAGIVFAVPASACDAARELLAPMVAAMKATPVASFVILALVWLDSRSLAVFIAFLMAFPPIYLGVLEGAGQADPQLLEMARLYQVPVWRQALRIYLPAVLPGFRAAASVAMGLCWKAGTAAELIGVPRGSLGERLYNAKIYFLTADLFAWTAVIILLSALFERLFLRALDWLSERMGAA